MQVLVTTDNHIEGSERLTRYVESIVEAATGRFGKQVTRVEVHLTDENGGQKVTENDHRCAMEARLAGLHPVAVTHKASSIDEALAGAGDKLEKALDKTIDKVAQKKGRTSFSGDPQ
jgi:ribosomal subunit interface protein